jgi:hypothetical protein
MHTQRAREYTIARYDLTDGSGLFGQAIVWSEGAYRERHSTMIELRLSLRNASAQALEVSAADLQLESVHADDMSFDALRPAESGTFRVAPDETRTLTLHFVLPKAVSSPSNVTQFELKWRVRSGAQSYSQRTAFEEESRPALIPSTLPTTYMPAPK